MMKLLRRPVIRGAVAISAAGQGIMVLVMTATPLAMKYCGFSVDVSANVIRWHLIGMFLPAFLRRADDRPVWPAPNSVTRGIYPGDKRCLCCVGYVGFRLFDQLISAWYWLEYDAVGRDKQCWARRMMMLSAAMRQSLMELGNSITATIGSLASGALIVGVGWNPVNYGVPPVLVVALLLLWRGIRRAAITCARLITKETAGLADRRLKLQGERGVSPRRD